jgi:hypothetical protein
MTRQTAIPLPHVSGPANDALAAAGTSSLNDLATHNEREIAGLHGMGPKDIRILHEALAEHDVAFAAASLPARSTKEGSRPSG